MPLQLDKEERRSAGGYHSNKNFTQIAKAGDKG